MVSVCIWYIKYSNKTKHLYPQGAGNTILSGNRFIAVIHFHQFSSTRPQMTICLTSPLHTNLVFVQYIYGMDLANPEISLIPFALFAFVSCQWDQSFRGEKQSILKKNVKGYQFLNMHVLFAYPDNLQKMKRKKNQAMNCIFYFYFFQRHHIIYPPCLFPKYLLVKFLTAEAIQLQRQMCRQKKVNELFLIVLDLCVIDYVYLEIHFWKINRKILSMINTMYCIQNVTPIFA